MVVMLGMEHVKLQVGTLPETNVAPENRLGPQ